MATGTAEGVPGLDEVLAPAGWPYASGLPADADDPGRFHALFGRDSLITALALLPVRPDVAAAGGWLLGALERGAGLLRDRKSVG